MKPSNGNAQLSLTIKQIYDVANYVIENHRLTKPEKDGVRELASTLECQARQNKNEPAMNRKVTETMNEDLFCPHGCETGLRLIEVIPEEPNNSGECKEARTCDTCHVLVYIIRDDDRK